MSRAIDAAVAAKVMGWKFPVSADRGHPHGVQDHWKDCENNTIYLPDQLPYFSTDIAAAWQVVEKMKSFGWRVAIEDCVNRYRVNYSRGVTWEWRNNIEHVSVPLAICLAALRALNVELPKENA